MKAGPPLNLHHRLRYRGTTNPLLPNVSPPLDIFLSAHSITVVGQYSVAPKSSRESKMLASAAAATATAITKPSLSCSGLRFSSDINSIPPSTPVAAAAGFRSSCSAARSFRIRSAATKPAKSPGIL
ncbi:hypothetical protein BHE74_00002997 [Ensete ventricosum]|nr:hypothetical protein BHE74_00002997 [Ensete ventricosum]